MNALRTTRLLLTHVISRRAARSSILVAAMALACLLAAAASAQAAVTLDGAVSTGTADGVATINVAHTTGTGADRLMLVGISANSYTGLRAPSPA